MKTRRHEHGRKQNSRTKNQSPHRTRRAVLAPPSVREHGKVAVTVEGGRELAVDRGDASSHSKELVDAEHVICDPPPKKEQGKIPQQKT